MENLLKLNNNKFIPIICIPSTANIKVNSNSHVLHIYELNKTILSHKETILDSYNEIYKAIDNLNIVDKDKRKEHIKYAKEIKKNKSINENNCCPKCGYNLIKRTGKYGEFYGCSNYPKCKYTKKIS